MTNAAAFEEYVRKMEQLIMNNGLKVLSDKWMKENERSLAFSMAASKVKLDEIAETLGVFDSMRAYYHTRC